MDPVHSLLKMITARKRFLEHRLPKLVVPHCCVSSPLYSHIYYNNYMFMLSTTVVKCCDRYVAAALCQMARIITTLKKVNSHLDSRVYSLQSRSSHAWAAITVFEIHLDLDLTTQKLLIKTGFAFLLSHNDTLMQYT